ncbi:hypothetical protein AWB79_03883 [Caballeronia hypogeia]|uniref:TolA protein n=1 Tax=Caballeronia hypogeia TaxID=1777140 RepID=A0A158BMJ0_9BURK|nr:hypothetical protein [Caballeronia hypogeia]SAK70976.1 hypothetical protein AWB79_03883 [Caballeronia hypogeia]
MTETLIAVEGNLRLPTLRPLTHPSLSFGQQWLPARARPVRSQTEIELFGARLETGYVAALSLSDTDSPYSAVSLWGVFVKEEMSHGMLSLREVLKRPAADPLVEPIHLAVAAPVAAGTRKSFFSKPVAAAISIASAGFILWMIFGTEPGSSRKTPSSVPDARAQVGAQQATPEVDRPRSVGKTTKDDPVVTRTETVPAVVDAGIDSEKSATASGANPAKTDVDLAAERAARREAVRMEAARREAVRLEAAHREAAKREAKKQEIASRAAAKREARKLELEKRETARREALARKAAKREAAHREAMARAAERRETMARESARREAAKREAMAMARETVRRKAAEREAMASDRESGMRRAALHAPVQREPAASERLKSVRATSVDIARNQSARTTDSLNAATLYEMLQHSPTLDSNATSRSTANTQ